MAGRAAATAASPTQHSLTVPILLLAFVCLLPSLYMKLPSGAPARLADRQALETLLPQERPGYNWTFYHKFNNVGKTGKKAAAHYRRVGKFEGYIAAPFRLKLQYVACGGLCNQLLSHVHAFIIARAAGAADIVLPPAMHRPSFDTVVHRWNLEPLEGLLDIDRMIEYWKPKGLEVLKTPEIQSFPGMDTHTFPPGDLRYERGGERCLYTKFYGKRPDQLDSYLKGLRKSIAKAAKPTLLGDPTNQIPCVYVDIGCSLLQLETDSMLDKAREAAEGLFFNRRLEGLADQIVAGLGPDFNGLHLRNERDASGWHAMFGGLKEFLEETYTAMRTMNFTTSSTVYLASGMISFSNGTELSDIEAEMTKWGLLKTLTYKEKLLPAEMLAGLKSEQLALLDLLVLSKAKRLVGFGPSSFSWYLQEFRALRGIPKDYTLLVHPKRMPPHKFNKSARFSERRRLLLLRGQDS